MDFFSRISYIVDAQSIFSSTHAWRGRARNGGGAEQPVGRWCPAHRLPRAKSWPRALWAFNRVRGPWQPAYPYPPVHIFYWIHIEIYNILHEIGIIQCLFPAVYRCRCTYICVPFKGRKRIHVGVNIIFEEQ